MCDFPHREKALARDVGFNEHEIRAFRKASLFEGQHFTRIKRVIHYNDLGRSTLLKHIEALRVAPKVNGDTECVDVPQEPIVAQDAPSQWAFAPEEMQVISEPKKRLGDLHVRGRSVIRCRRSNGEEVEVKINKLAQVHKFQPLLVTGEPMMVKATPACRVWEFVGKYPRRRGVY